MKIIGLKVKDFRKLSAVELKFNQDGITTISGDNQAGKTSVLDSIEYLFKGRTVINEDIIQHGKEKMDAEIDLGKYTVKRIKTKKTDRLEITNKEGFRLSEKPQAFLDKLVNDLTFNPFPFLNKTGDQKLKFMMDFLKLDTEAIDQSLKQLEIDRLVCGKEGKNLGTVAEVEAVESVNIRKLIQAKEEIDRKNDAAIDKARIERDKKVKDAHKFNNEQRIKQEKILSCSKELAENDKHIKGLYKQLDDIKNKINSAEEKTRTLAERQRALPEPEQQISTDIHVEPPVLASTEAIMLQIKEAEQTIKKASEYQEFLNKKRLYEDKRAEYQRFTEKITSLRNKKLEMLRSAETRVEGLEIREDGLYFNGIYSENWSDSEGIEISCALCMAMKPELKALFVDRGESFGKKRFSQLEAWAKKAGIQIILTKVVDEEPASKENTYYIIDGAVQK